MILNYGGVVHAHTRAHTRMHAHKHRYLQLLSFTFS